jgi:adenylyl-sulfate kinase
MNSILEAVADSVAGAVEAQQAGAHRIDAQIEASEAFPLDDRRTLALDVADKSRVLLIDGQPDEELGETFFLQAAFEPPESGVEVTVATDTATDELDLATFDVVWLCNVQSPTASLCQRLEAFVASGGGLVVTAGALVDATRYDELLWRSGQGLLPMPFGEIAGDPDKPEVATLVKPDHPVCGSVAEIVELLLANVVMVKRWLALGDDPTGRTQVVARIRDAEGPPLLVTRTYAPPVPSPASANGAAANANAAIVQPGGEVAQFAITADTFWCNLPSTDLFLVLANQLHRTSARRRDTSGNNLLPDGSLHLTLDAGSYRPDATVRSLGGDDERTFTASEAPVLPPQSSQQPTSQQPASQPTPSQPNAPTPPTDTQPKPPAPPSLTVPMHELRRLGAYELELARHDGAVEKRLFALGKHSFLLDGDNVRHGLNKDLGFTDADRVENVRRVGEVAKLMADAGLIVLAAFISPFRAERDMVRAMLPEGEFIEIFVDTPLAEAEKRDVKGLYAKARRGEIKHFTGISSPYEAPENPELRIDTTKLTAEGAADTVVSYLKERGRLTKA